MVTWLLSVVSRVVLSGEFWRQSESHRGGHVGQVHCQVLSDRRQHVSEQQNRARVANWECGVGTHSCMGMLRLVTTGVMENPAGTPEEGTAHPTTTTATAAAITIMLRTSRAVADTRPA
jgi:hypothetical protein